MFPIGPYRSPWADKPLWVIKTLQGKREVVLVVPEGSQPDQGTPHLTVRDAAKWLDENGYRITSSPA